VAAWGKAKREGEGGEVPLTQAESGGEPTPEDELVKGKKRGKMVDGE